VPTMYPPLCEARLVTSHTTNSIGFIVITLS
jgi:hypothetical protein